MKFTCAPPSMVTCPEGLEEVTLLPTMIFSATKV